MLRRVLTALALSTVVGIWTPGPGAAAGTATPSDFDTLPTADVAHPAGVLGDVWTFVVAEPGAEVRIRVDTRDDHDNATSNLDPTAFLFDQTGATLFGAGDDEVPCTRESVCGFACPQIGPLFLPPGEYEVPRPAAGDPQSLCWSRAQALSTGRVGGSIDGLAHSNGAP
jgi:hypothetical protein